MAAHTYWRLNVTANNGDITFLAIAEIEMRAILGGADQCSGGVASASSADATSPASNAFDNDTTTRWSTVTSTLTGWIRYQFASPVDVVQYTIRAHPTAPTRSPKNWTLEWSDDGTTWVVVDTHTDVDAWANGEVRVFNVPVGFTDLRLHQGALEVLSQGTASSVELHQAVLETIRTNSAAEVEVRQVCLEVLRPNAASMPDGRPYVFSST